jgi:hypothetical protein
MEKGSNKLAEHDATVQIPLYRKKEEHPPRPFSPPVYDRILRRS